MWISGKSRGTFSNRLQRLLPKVSNGRLLHPRIAVERRQFVHPLHPPDPLRRLHLDLRRKRVGIIEGRGLHIHFPRQPDIVRVEQAGPTFWAELPPPILRRGIFLGLALDLQLVLFHQRPGDHRRSRLLAAIAAVADRAPHRLLGHFVADRATMAATLRHPMSSFCS